MDKGVLGKREISYEEGEREPTSEEDSQEESLQSYEEDRKFFFDLATRARAHLLYRRDPETRRLDEAYDLESWDKNIRREQELQDHAWEAYKHQPYWDVKVVYTRPVPQWQVRGDWKRPRRRSSRKGNMSPRRSSHPPRESTRI